MYKIKRKKKKEKKRKNDLQLKIQTPNLAAIWRHISSFEKIYHVKTKRCV